MGAWGYIFSYLFAIGAGVIIGMLIDNDNTYKVTIRKIKQRGEGNRLDTDMEVNLPIQTKREQRKAIKNDSKQSRKERRLNKKL